MKKFICVAAAVLCLCSCSGENTIESSATESIVNNEQIQGDNVDENIYPYTIDAIAVNGNVYPQIFEKSPARAFPNNQGLAETMLKLGLQDSIVGVGAPSSEVEPSVAEEFNSLNLISDISSVNKELILGANADVVLGRSTLFSDDTGWGNGTIEDLNGLGIKTVTQKASLFNATVDDLFADVRELGMIFNIQETANAFADKMENKYKNLVELTKNEESKTFIIITNMGDEDIYSFGIQDISMHADAFKGVKMNYLEEHLSGVISPELLIDMNPDIIIVLSADGEGLDGEATRDMLLNSENLSSVTAVENSDIYIQDFTATMSFNYRLLDVIESTVHDVFGA
ncbi:MAG: ABC transporter substrate-binding protein [Lachnospirales bacterium]